MKLCFCEIYICRWQQNRRAPPTHTRTHTLFIRDRCRGSGHDRRTTKKKIEIKTVAAARTTPDTCCCCCRLYWDTIHDVYTQYTASIYVRNRTLETGLPTETVAPVASLPSLVIGTYDDWLSLGYTHRHPNIFTIITLCILAAVVVGVARASFAATAAVDEGKDGAAWWPCDARTILTVAKIATAADIPTD